MSIERLLEIEKEMQEILDCPDVGWKVKHKMIFNYRYELMAMRISFDYYDPDTTYEEDAKAYVKGYREFLRSS